MYLYVVNKRDMNTVVHIGGKPVILLSQDVEEEINIDDLCRINHSNLYGEIVTISALLNKIGVWKAEAEYILAKSKLECDTYESLLRKSIRVEANQHQGKFFIGKESIKLTEKAVDEAVYTDEKFQKLKKDVVENQRILSIMDSWFWAINDKSKKLSSLVKPVTPEEFYSELVEAKVNTFLIKKNI